MSKKLNIKIECDCGKPFVASLYRSIWGEQPENRELVMSDNINVAVCPDCGEKIKVPLPFLYTNVPKKFAVWYEPQYDSNIDDDVAGYAKFMGKDSFYAKAPRIKNWQEFKDTIIKFETGVLKGGTATPSKEGMEMFADFIKNFPAKKDPYKKLKAFFTIFAIYQIVALLILADDGRNGICQEIFSIDFCRADGFQYFIMNFLIPFSAFLLFIWRKEIGKFFKKILSKLEDN